MKRLVAILLAGIMVLTMGVTVFAATSPKGSETDANIKAAEGVDVVDIEFDTAQFEFSDADVLAAAKALGVDTSAAKVGLKGDLHLKNGKTFSGKATITFNATDVIAALHYNGSAWEKVGDSNVATFSTFSPVAFIVKDAAAQPADTGNQQAAQPAGTGNQQAAQPANPGKQNEAKTDDKQEAKPAEQSKDASKSPQTGEAPFVAIMSVVAILAAAGVVVSCRKVSER